MHIVVTSESDTKGTLTYSGISVPCALGKTGLALEKEEGDGKTPIGTFPLRRVLYRPDRVEELYDLEKDPDELVNLAVKPEHGNRNTI